MIDQLHFDNNKMLNLIYEQNQTKNFLKLQNFRIK